MIAMNETNESESLKKSRADDSKESASTSGQSKKASSGSRFWFILFVGLAILASALPRLLKMYSRYNRINEQEHEHEYDLHNENERRASGAKRGASPLHRTITNMNTDMNTNMNSTMKTGAERAERSHACDAPPLRRQQYEHAHKNELHNENGRRTSRAKPGERGASPDAHINV